MDIKFTLQFNENFIQLWKARVVGSFFNKLAIQATAQPDLKCVTFIEIHVFIPGI
jgi:hypothetical protein